MSKQQAWISFWLVGVIWGSSFMFIRVGVEQLGPFQVVFIRTAIAALGLTLVAVLRRLAFHADLATIRDLVILGVVNTILPFALITWGETSIDSGLAAVLQSTAALFTLLVAHFSFADERITWKKVGGLVVGFIGVCILMSRSWEGGGLQTSSLAGQLAVVVASVCYAFGGVYTRKVISQRVEPVVAAAGAMTTAALVTGVLMLIAPLAGGHPVILPGEMQPNVLFAVVMLGLVNTFLAYLLFYPTIKVLGAARGSMVTYIVPAVGLALGAIFLQEAVDARLLIGALLILTGIAIVNLKVGDLLRRAPRPAEAQG
jgi:drug/metabolite transporter (DMT)-like permease